MPGLMLGLAQAAVIAGGAAAVPDLPATGLISEWRFAEGSGTSVNDEVGANDINLALPTNPNATWTAYGIATALGLIQTPSIAGVRTVAMLVRVGRGETAGFLLSGGNGGSGSGILGDSVTNTYAYHVGGGRGVSPLRFRASTGGSATRINRGYFQLLFCQFASAGASVLGFGGRHSTTTSRCTDFEIMWAGAWSGTLTDQNRSDVYGYCRNLASLRSKPIDWRDCATYENVVALFGQSNADGRAPISTLSAPDQARTTPSPIHIMPASGSVAGSVIYPPAALTMGTNQQQSLPATNFGPEMSAAWAHEDAVATRRLIFSKSAVGSTYLSPSSAGVSTVTTTWNPAEVESSSLFHNALRNFWDVEHYYLNLGIGPRFRGIWWMQGEQDATNVTASSSYQADLQTLYDAVKLYTAATSLPIVVGRIRDVDPSMNATAAANVRAAQAAFVAANPGVATLIDTDGFALLGDNVHYSAVGMKSLGQALYAATSLAA